MLGMSLCVSIASAREEYTTTIKDLRYGEAVYHYFQDKYFSAITNLLVMEERGGFGKQGDDAEILLGGLYLGYGLYNDAGRKFEQLIEQEGLVNPSSRDRAWFYLGKTDYQHGQLDSAEDALLQVTGNLPENRDEERLNLLANIYLQKNQYDKAQSLLESFHGKSDWQTYARYNLGVTLLKKGELEQGLEQLDRVGKSKAGDKEIKALRDKANLALGYVLIRDNKPVEAREYFQRIRLAGPLTSKALLGIGWAFAAKEEYKKALIPWMEMDSSNLLDPAVQETILAIPYTLEKMGKSKLALVHYNKAANRYDEELQRFERYEQAIRSGGLIQALTPENMGTEAALPTYHTHLPDSEVVPYLYNLIATNGFQQAVRNYHELLYQDYILERWQQYMPTFTLLLNERKLSYQKKLPIITSDERISRLGDLRKRRDVLAQKVASIEQKDNIFALATTDEKDLIEDIKTLEKNLEKVSSTTDYPEMRQRFEFVRGLLYFDIIEDFMPRYWRIKKQLAELDTGLEQTQRANESLKKAWEQAPASFEGINTVIVAKQKKIDRLKKRVASSLARQTALIERMALNELDKQRARLESYNMRAKFALARLYDTLSRTQGVEYEK